MIQMCWIMPGPSMSARVVFESAGRSMHGRTFQPLPSIEPALLLVGDCLRARALLAVGVLGADAARLGVREP